MVEDSVLLLNRDALIGVMELQVFKLLINIKYNKIYIFGMLTMRTKIYDV